MASNKAQINVRLTENGFLAVRVLTEYRRVSQAKLIEELLLRELKSVVTDLSANAVATGNHSARLTRTTSRP